MKGIHMVGVDISNATFEAQWCAPSVSIDVVSIFHPKS